MLRCTTWKHSWQQCPKTSTLHEVHEQGRPQGRPVQAAAWAGSAAGGDVQDPKPYMMYASRGDLVERLRDLEARLAAMRDAFEGAQDLLDLPALAIWEVSRQS